MSSDTHKIESAHTWVEVDGDAIRHNVSLLKGLVGDRLLMAVVKANAYGHGMVEVARLAIEAGAEWVGVFSVDEGLALRSAGIDAPVLVFGPTPAERLTEAWDADLSLTVPSLELARELGAAGFAGVGVHLKVETGTNRQGIDSGELYEALDILGRGGARVEGIYTHFADIEDTTDHSFAESQLARFRQVLDGLPEGMEIPLSHAACSAATILFPSTYFDMVRTGIALYGLWPSKETRVSAGALGRNALELRPAMTWKTRISQLKSVPSGEFVGYGRTFRTTRETRIAVLPVGYADGYDRGLSNVAHVLVRGVRAPVRGRVCMNVTMIDVTDVPDARPGDEVVLLGSQGDESVSAEDLARHAATINYEIVTRVAPGAPRIVV